MKMVRDFILLVSKVTADGNWSHEIKRRLLLGRKTMIQPWQQIEKQRHYFANKVPSSQSYSFSSSHVKKAEHRRNDAFELWCWRRLLRVPWTARRSNQSILRETSPEYSLEGLLLKLKLQSWQPDVKNWLARKDPDARKDWRLEEKGMTEDEMVGWHHWLNGHGFGWTLGVGDEQGGLECCSSWVCKESDMT